MFPRLFLLALWQATAGGMLSLAVPRFAEVGTGYFRSTAAVYLALAVLTLCGSLWLGAPGRPGGLPWPEAAAEGLFVLLAAGYVATLWLERPVLRARLYPAACVAGVLRLALATLSLGADGRGLALAAAQVPGLLAPAPVLGTSISMMLLGHWYLVDRELALAPLLRMHAFLVVSLLFHGAVLLAGAVALGVWPDLAPRTPVTADFLLLAARLAVSPGLAFGVAWLVWKTLKIPHTMAATGLAYIGILAVLVGQLLGTFVLYRIGLPL